MDKDRIEGKADKAKGYVKEKAGQILNDPDLEAEGQIDQAKGEMKDAFGKAKDKARDIAKKVTE